MRNQFYSIILLAYVLLFHSHIYAEKLIDNDSVSSAGQVIEHKEFDHKKWEKLTKNIEYVEREKKPKEAKKNNKQVGKVYPNFPLLDSGIFTALFYLLVIGILGFLLFKLFSNNSVSVKKIDPITQVPFNVINDEENIHEANFDRILQEALQQREYRLAIRVHYLIALKELSNQQLINWKKDTTNSEYIKQLNEKPLLNLFKKITTIYEKVWFRETELDESNYYIVLPAFTSFMSSINRKEEFEK